MRTLGNIFWHVPFCGFLSALFHLAMGSLFVLTVVGAPIGLGMIQYSKFLLTPFSSSMINDDKLNVNQNPYWKTYSTIVWICYLPIGILFCGITLLQIVGLCFTIVGIPVAMVLAKSLGTYLNPVNKICVSVDVRNELSRMKAQEYIQSKLNK